jgi:hypothetical protein
MQNRGSPDEDSRDAANPERDRNPEPNGRILGAFGDSDAVARASAILRRGHERRCAAEQGGQVS